MTAPSFSGLQTAIKMPSSRVRITESYKDLNGLYIHSMIFDHPFLGKQSLRFNRNLNCITGKKGTGKTCLYNLMQDVVNPERPKIDGDVSLFVEQITEGVSKYYAYSRNAGQDMINVYALDPITQTVTTLDLARAKECYLQPKFYNAARMEELIIDKDKLQIFLRKSFGEPTKVNVQKFNDQFSTPRFLDEQKDQILTLTMDKTGYQLAMNLQWRTGSVNMQDFFSLSLSLRRTAMMCIIILSGQFGPVIIDAPEDQFDNEDMMKFLVPVIQEYKDAHQMLLFTNHPMLAVNTDPDNYMIMQSKDIISGFAIDAKDQKPLLLNILEGSLESFRKRASRYE
jgi:energy-coupling factor transporter ATP-binding protein EcfA2